MSQRGCPFRGPRASSGEHSAREGVQTRRLVVRPLQFREHPLLGHRYGLVLPALAHGAVRSRGALINYTTAFAALLVVLIAPGLGALADLHQRRMPYLVFFTLVVVFLTAGLDFTDELTGSVLVAVAFFVVAVVAYQMTQLLYFALLPSVSAGRGTGTVSGYSQAGGLIGTFIAVAGLTLFIAPDSFLGFKVGGPKKSELCSVILVAG